mmetsp:Transcript_28046/g.61504  ORF Transcript_28046/g.61504 Transcript_28046/m.61504 type:complete len:519 (+) Transcript_28046:165-1721(+)
MSREPTDDGFALPYLRQLWGDRELSDAKLIIGTTQHDDCERTIVQSLVCDVHSHVLIGGSEYFMAKVKNWRSTKKQGRGSSKKKQRTAEDSRMVLEMVLEPDDDPDAARQAVRFLYFGELSEEVKAEPAMLFKVARMADAFLMPACLRACVRALSALSPEQLLSSCCLGQVLQLPEVYKPSLGFGAAVATAAGELLKQVRATSPPELGSGTPLGASFMDLMGSVPHLIATPDLLTTFMELPFEWVCWWASSDQLATDHENSVALLLLTWVEGEKGKTCSLVQKEQVVNCIRLQDLSTSYMNSNVPAALKLLGEEVQESYACALALHHACANNMAWDYAVSVPRIPWAWTRACVDFPRDTVVASPGQLPLTVTLNVPEAKLTELMQQAREAPPPASALLEGDPTYVMGWTLRLGCQVLYSDAGFDVGLFVLVTLALPGFPALQTALACPSRYIALAHVRLVCQKADATQKFLNMKMIMPSSAMGVPKFLTPQPVSSSEGLGEFLVEGELRFRVTVKAVE